MEHHKMNHENDSLASIMHKAEKAKNDKNYEKALELLEIAKAHAFKDIALQDNLPNIISRQVLCTYKLKSLMN